MAPIYINTSSVRVQFALVSVLVFLGDQCE